MVFLVFVINSHRRSLRSLLLLSSLCTLHVHISMQAYHLLPSHSMRGKNSYVLDNT